MWEIKSKDNILKATPSTKPEYNGKWMEESYVTVSVESPTPIDFEIGDYIIYRGERFEINYDPGKIKSAPRFAKGDAFKYEDIKFNSLADELLRCDFLDVVLNDNQLHFTGLPKFSFYGGVRELAGRMQANLDRTYGRGTWQVIVSSEYTGTKEVNISVDTIKVQGALSILVNDLETYYTIKGRTLTIGAAGIPAGHLFQYGKGKGLYEIEQTAEADQAIVTRVRAYGSTRNLPHRYYNSLSGADGKKLIPDNMAVQNLMLPSFPYTTQDPYIDSPNIAKLGIREGTIFFDGSGDLEEIYPSIEGMTAEQLRAAGVPCNSVGALDEIVSAEQMTDNGVGEINEGATETTAKPSTFKVTLKDLSFDINDHLTTETATISFKTGKLGGRDFEIVGCKKIEAGGKVTGYELELNRVYDDSIKLWFPYASYNAKAGDKYVVLHIEMPEVYIKAAAQRVKEAAELWLSKNDYSRSVYAPKIDEIFMARQHDEAMASGGKIVSLHDTLKEGMMLLFEDEDLNIDAAVFIDRLTINEEGKIPTYEVVLKEEKTVGRLDKMQNQIDSLASGKGQGGGGYTAAQIRSLIDAYGGTCFLSKLKDDRSKGQIASDMGIEVGNFLAGVSGAIIGKEAETGHTFGEMDKLFIRIKAYFETLTIINAEALAGEQRITPGGGIKCTEVAEKGLVEVKKERPAVDEAGNPVLDSDGNPVMEEYTEMVDNGVPADVYRCYFLSEQDGEKTETKIIAGDQAIAQMFNAKTGTSNKVSNHRYWRLVTAVSNDAYTDDSGNHYGYIDLSKSDCEKGSSIPQAGDEIVQFGNRTDRTRQAAMVFSTVDADAPSIKLFTGIDSYTLVDKDIVSYGYDPVKGNAYFNCYGDTFIGDKNGSTFIKYDRATKSLDAKVKLSILSTITSETTDEEGNTVVVEKPLGGYFRELQEQIDGVVESFNGQGAPTLTNYPASGWATDEERRRHNRDVYTDITPYVDDKTTPTSGQSWRWYYNSESDYGWVKIADSDAVRALQLAKLSVVDNDVLFIQTGSMTEKPALPTVDTEGTITGLNGWSTTAPEWKEGMYIWQTTYVKRGNGVASFTPQTCLSGRNGRGIAKIEEEYYLSTSQTQLSGGSWKGEADKPAWVAGMFMWTRTKVTYTDGTVEYVGAVCVTGTPGTSVLAEYSADGKTWHPAFTAGDVWMRTSADGGNTWSPAMRIEGEKGDSYSNNLLLGTKGESVEVDTSTKKEVFKKYKFETPFTTADRGRKLTISFRYECSGVNYGADYHSARIGFESSGRATDGSSVFLTAFLPFAYNSAGNNGSGYSVHTVTIPSNMASWNDFGQFDVFVESGKVRIWDFKVELGETKNPQWTPAASEMVGKDGQYRKFQWAKNNSATVEPTSGWQDTPLTSLAGEYVWMRSGIVIPPATAPAKDKWDDAIRLTGDKGSDGESVYMLDLSNETSGVICDAAGKVTGKLPTSQASVYKGGTKIDNSKVTYSIAQQTGATASITSAGLVTITALSDDNATVVVQAVADGVTLSSNINVYKVKAGANGQAAVMYSIETSVDNITKSMTGELSASSVTCSVYKTTGDAAQVLSGDHTLTYLRLPDGATGTLTRTNGVSNAVQILADTEAVIFELKRGNTMLDHERVPVLADASDLEVGGRNLLKKSDVGYNNSSYPTAKYYFGKEAPVEGETYTLTLWGQLDPTLTGEWSIYNSGGTILVSTLDKVSDGVYRKTFRWVANNAANTHIEVYAFVYQATHGTNSISRIKLEKGNVATDWSPAPEDIEDRIDTFDYLKEALKGNTVVDGGLVLSSLIKLGTWSGSGDQATMSKVWAGMSGVYHDGKSIASWWGGDMIDRENLQPGQSIDDAAASLVRLDGTGYLVNGNFSWNLDGDLLCNRGSFKNVDIEGRLLSGDSAGEHIEINPTDKVIRIFNKNGALCAELNGSDWTSEQLMPAAAGGVINITAAKATLTANGTGTASVTTQKDVTGAYETKNPGAIKIQTTASLSMAVNGARAVEKPTMIQQAELYCVVTTRNSSGTVINTVRYHVVGWAQRADGAAHTESATKTLNVPVPAGMHTVSYELRAAGSTATATVETGSVAYITDWFMARYFSNGFALTQNTLNYLIGIYESKVMKLMLGGDFYVDGVKQPKTVYIGTVTDSTNKGSEGATKTDMTYMGTTSGVTLTKGANANEGYTLTFPARYGLTTANALIELTGIGNAAGSSNSPVKASIKSKSAGSGGAFTVGVWISDDDTTNFGSFQIKVSKC